MNNPLFELDEQIAEHVMNFAVWPCCAHGETVIGNDHYEKLFKAECPQFRPSTNLMHAFQVVDYMVRERGYTEFLMYAEFKQGAQDMEYFAQFKYFNEELSSPLLFFATEKALTVAICEAALKAVSHAFP